MASEEERAKKNAYMKEWYHRNKERLAASPKVQESKRLSTKKFYANHKEVLKERRQAYRTKNLEKLKASNRQYYHDNKEKVSQKRNSDAYKSYAREYRIKNKDKISIAQRIKAKEWVRKQVDSLSDAYIIMILTSKEAGSFASREEVMLHPEVIEIKRSEILIARIKKKIKTVKHEKDIE